MPDGDSLRPCEYLEAHVLFYLLGLFLHFNTQMPRFNPSAYILFIA